MTRVQGTVGHSSPSLTARTRRLAGAAVVVVIGVVVAVFASRWETAVCIDDPITDENAASIAALMETQLDAELAYLDQRTPDDT